MEKTLVLIPSSRFVPPEMQFDVGKVPPVLIPIGGKPLLRFIIEQYEALPGNTTFALIVNEGEELIREALSRHTNISKIKLVPVPLVESFSEAVLNALQQFDLSAYDALIVHFGDTLVYADFATGKDTIFYHDFEESYRWTSFKEEDGRITRITDRFHADYLDSNHIFVGWFYFTKPAQFLAHLARAQHPSLDRFYAALLGYLKDLPCRLVEVKDWLDFGHIDNYHQAKKKFVNKRFFNQVQIDERRPIIRKTSSKAEKLSAEIRWYLELPSALRCYIPQIFDYSLGPENPFVKMEYYGYPTLCDLYLYGGHNLGIWNQALEGLFAIISEMRAYRLNTNEAAVQETLRSMYGKKNHGAAE